MDRARLQKCLCLVRLQFLARAQEHGRSQARPLLAKVLPQQRIAPTSQPVGDARPAPRRAMRQLHDALGKLASQRAKPAIAAGLPGKIKFARVMRPPDGIELSEHAHSIARFEAQEMPIDEQSGDAGCRPPTLAVAQREHFDVQPRPLGRGDRSQRVRRRSRNAP